MTITLNHTIVPARDKIAGARFFACIFGLKRGRADHFAPVKVNKSLTLLFDDHKNSRAIISLSTSVTANSTPSCAASREGKSLTAVRPGALEDGKLNNWNGGRGIYFRDPDGHVLELMTVPQ